MSTQIAVRLPDDLVQFIDDLITAGRFDSRAAVVTRELRRLQRRVAAENDAGIYRAEGDDPELEAIAEHRSRYSVRLDG